MLAQRTYGRRNRFRTIRGLLYGVGGENPWILLLSIAVLAITASSLGNQRHVCEQEMGAADARPPEGRRHRSPRPGGADRALPSGNHRECNRNTSNPAIYRRSMFRARGAVHAVDPRLPLIHVTTQTAAIGQKLKKEHTLGRSLYFFRRSAAAAADSYPHRGWPRARRRAAGPKHFVWREILQPGDVCKRDFGASRRSGSGGAASRSPRRAHRPADGASLRMNTCDPCLFVALASQCEAVESSMGALRTGGSSSGSCGMTIQQMM